MIYKLDKQLILEGAFEKIGNFIDDKKKAFGAWQDKRNAAEAEADDAYQNGNAQQQQAAGQDAMRKDYEDHMGEQ
jgi:hypothetical protein